MHDRDTQEVLKMGVVACLAFQNYDQGSKSSFLFCLAGMS